MDLRELWDRGRQAWPEVELSEERFSELLRDLPSGDAGEAAELYLACGWVDGLASAGQVMARDYLPPLRRRLARMGLAASEIDEVVQETCERLIGRDAEGRARLVKYAGQGRLQSLLVVVGTRIAIDSFRKADREQPDYDALAALAAASSDPRAELLRVQKQTIFKAAVETALEALEPRERTVLRMHLIDGLTLDKIGDYYKVHRVTVSRWLAAARVAIIERARAAAQAQFGLSDTEFDAAYTGSQLGLSLERLLGD